MRVNTSKLSRTLLEEIKQRVQQGEQLWRIIEQYDLIRKDKLRIIRQLDNQAYRF